MASNGDMNKGEQDHGPKFTLEYRIKELNKIEENIAKLLQSAGVAVKALTNQPMTDETGSETGNIEQRKETFTSAASDYFSLLSSVDVNLRRQIYALEEANLIPDTSQKDSTAGTDSQQAEDDPNVMGGSLGNIDVGWLNSRDDQVEKERAAELWAQAQEIVERLAENEAGATKQDEVMKG